MPITINEVRLSYPSLFTPSSFNNDPEQAKYQVQLMIPKGSPALAQIKAEYDRVLKKALEEKKLTRSTATPLIRPIGTTKGLLVDCDEDPDRYDPEIYGGHYLMNAKSKGKPTVVDRWNHVIEAKDSAIYGGCWANVNVNIYPYNKVGSGIAVGLNGVQKTRDDEAFGGGRPSVESMFGAPAADTTADIYD